MGDYEIDADALFSDDEDQSPAEEPSAPAHSTFAPPAAPALNAHQRRPGAAPSLGSLDTSKLSKFTSNFGPPSRRGGRHDNGTNGRDRGPSGRGGFSGGYGGSHSGGRGGRGRSGLRGLSFGSGGRPGGGGGGLAHAGYRGDIRDGGHPRTSHFPPPPAPAPVGAHMHGGGGASSSGASGFIHPSRLAAAAREAPLPPSAPPPAADEEARRKARMATLLGASADDVLRRMASTSDAPARKRPGRRRSAADEMYDEREAAARDMRVCQARAESERDRQGAPAFDLMKMLDRAKGVQKKAPARGGRQAGGRKVATEARRDGGGRKEAVFGGGLKREKRIAGVDLTSVYAKVAINPEAAARERREEEERKREEIVMFERLRETEREERRVMAMEKRNDTVAGYMRLSQKLHKEERRLFSRSKGGDGRKGGLGWIGLELKELKDPEVDALVEELCHVEIEII